MLVFVFSSPSALQVATTFISILAATCQRYDLKGWHWIRETVSMNGPRLLTWGQKFCLEIMFWPANESTLRVDEPHVGH